MPEGRREPGPSRPRDWRSLDIGVYGARGIPSTYGGYETFLTTLLPELANREHQVTVYCRAGEISSDEPYLGVQRVVLPAVSGKQFSTLSHGAVAAAKARSAGHDVLLVVNVANAPFTAIGRMTGQRIVLNTDGQEWLRGKWGGAARAYFRASARIARFSATALVADCQAMADVYQREFGCPSTVIPYCFPLIEWTPSRAPVERLRLQENGYIIIGGRLNPENNIDTMAAAYTKTDIPLPLLVLGAANYDSPVERRLRDLAASDRRIRPIGHVDNRNDFLSLLRLAAVYVHGHSVGGLNPALIEAMGAMAQVVALDTPFNREALGSTGEFFAADMHDFGSVLEMVLARPQDEQARTRLASMERVRTTYDATSVVDAYEDLLLAAASAPTRPLISYASKWTSDEVLETVS